MVGNYNVKSKIEQEDSWFVGSHFAYASSERVRRIFRDRIDFIFKCIYKMKRIRDGPIKLLDTGCGDGFFLEKMRRIDGLELVGIDYNPLRIARARQVCPDIPIYPIDLRSPDVDLGTFDIILLNQVIEHIEDDTGLLKLVQGYLKRDGRLILGTTNEGCFLQRMRAVRHKCPQTDHVHFYTEKGVRNKLKKKWGFELNLYFGKYSFLVLIGYIII